MNVALPLGRFLVYGLAAALSSNSWITGLALGFAMGLIGISLEWRMKTWFAANTSFVSVLGFLWSLAIGGGGWADPQAVGFLAASCLLFVVLSPATPSAPASAMVAAGAVLMPAMYAGLHAAWLDVGVVHILSGLFGSCGVLYQSPLLWLGLVGSPGVRRVKPSTAIVCISAVAVGVLSLAVDTESADAPARTTLWLPFLLPGLARMFDRMQAFVARRPERFIGSAASMLILWNLLFMEQYRQVRIPTDETVSFADVTSNSADLLSRSVGSPVAWPVNWIFARRFQVPPDRWDSVAGRHLFASALASTMTIEFGDEDSNFATDEALIANGFLTRGTCGQGWCRDVVGAGRILLPVENAGTGDFMITLRARGQGALSMSFDKSEPAVIELAPTLADLTLRVPARLIDADVHVLSFHVTEGGRASLDRVTLARDLSAVSAR